ncbi:hypothetical protein VNO77_43901 [Canavalia gladiata]|uniref:Uncharacterized protein n=1 Tax=Canavalia gladiata TaxID=3824 RepID=A0AAN9PQ95_CANGL
MMNFVVRAVKATNDIAYGNYVLDVFFGKIGSFLGTEQLGFRVWCNHRWPNEPRYHGTDDKRAMTIDTRAYVFFRRIIHELRIKVQRVPIFLQQSDVEPHIILAMVNQDS